MSTSSLLLRLEGVLQAYGDTPQRRKFTTNAEPTKSAVVGMLYQALGRDFSEDPTDLARAVKHVRVDREGTLLKDFHTTMGVPQADEPDPPILSRSEKKARRKAETVDDVAMLEDCRGVFPTERFYIQDASFLVAVEGDYDFLLRLEEAVAFPRRMIWLGRKSCAPSRPLWVPGGLLKGVSALEALTTWPWLVKKGIEWVRLVFDLGLSSAIGELRRDWPISLDPRCRKFAPRRVEMRWLKADELRANQASNIAKKA